MVREILIGTIAGTIFGAIASVAFGQTEITGPARVIDGDTIVINGTHIRLYGIDAVEHNQTCQGKDGMTYECGRDATATLMELIQGDPVTCSEMGKDRYSRTIGICRTERSGELNAAMVRRGWAVDYKAYDKKCRYCLDQAAAKADGLGIWSGRFEMPSDFRHHHNGLR